VNQSEVRKGSVKQHLQRRYAARGHPSITKSFLESRKEESLPCKNASKRAVPRHCGRQVGMVHELTFVQRFIFYLLAAVGWYLSGLLSRPLSRKFFPSYRKLKPIAQRDWDIRIVSNSHGFFQIIMAFMFTPGYWTDMVKHSVTFHSFPMVCWNEPAMGNSDTLLGHLLDRWCRLLYARLHFNAVVSRHANLLLVERATPHHGGHRQPVLLVLALLRNVGKGKRTREKK